MPRVKIGPAAPDRETLVVEIARLRDLDIAQLRNRWQTVFGRRRPVHLPRHLLFRVLAYRLQADHLGDLDSEGQRLLDRSESPEKAGQRAADLGRRTAELGRAPCWAAKGTDGCIGWRCSPRALPGMARATPACRRLPWRSSAPGGTVQNSSACATSRRKGPQDDRQSAIGGFSHKPIRQNQASAVRAPAIIGTSSGSLHHRIAATHRAQKMIANMRRDIAVAPASELQANSRGTPDY